MCVCFVCDFNSSFCWMLQVLMCPEHEMEKVNMYCEVCRRPVCHLCKLGGSHANHKVTTMSSAYKILKVHHSDDYYLRKDRLGVWVLVSVEYTGICFVVICEDWWVIWIVTQYWLMIRRIELSLNTMPLLTKTWNGDIGKQSSQLCNRVCKALLSYDAKLIRGTNFLVRILLSKN